MATNGMTINWLNPLSALTADDKIPVWDTGASGEPTKEITAQNMANSVKSLASLPNTTEMNTAIAQSTADAAKTMFLGDVLESSSLDITLNKNTRYIIAIFGLSSTRMGLLLARTSGTTAYVHEVSMGTNVTFSANGLVLTISNTSTQTVQVYGIVINAN